MHRPYTPHPGVTRLDVYAREGPSKTVWLARTYPILVPPVEKEEEEGDDGGDAEEEDEHAAVQVGGPHPLLPPPLLLQEGKETVHQLRPVEVELVERVAGVVGHGGGGGLRAHVGKGTEWQGSYAG